MFNATLEKNSAKFWTKVDDREILEHFGKRLKNFFYLKKKNQKI